MADISRPSVIHFAPRLGPQNQKPVHLFTCSPVHLLTSTVSTSLFSGKFRPLDKFAEEYMEHGNVANVQTSPQAVAQARLDVACALLQLKGNADDYCLVCSYVETDGDMSMIEMVQCDSCSLWAHFECVQYEKESSTQYICRKCA
ncbi:uncharacterized protein LOC125799008 isoform X4 [Scomber scombrus]|uniref:Uncharacterized protein LOC125799008 isoform X4 n=1 Tax=Scomber scombrus TaxID=13677 RepID=A0AAV1PSG2_SCOSC